MQILWTKICSFTTLFLNMNSVESVLLENIDKPNSIFIFPTDIAASRWADHLLRLKSKALGSCSTIATGKFIAWDVFKGKSIKSKIQNKKSISSALRKIFVNRLVNENAVLVRQGKEPVLSSLISTQWASLGAQFAPWLTGILPQMGVWFRKSAGLPIEHILKEEGERAGSKFNGDDRDMYVLARRYAQFLEEHFLFEPAWENPPFNDNGNECFIFFPESLSDYGEYRELLNSNPSVKTISASDSQKQESETFFYANSRSEITESALYILALNEKQGINWDSIAVSIGDSDNYEPYVLREFTNRNIPHVKRTSKPLSDYPAGSFFRSLVNCVSGGFSFSSLVSLITNKNIPWKDADLIDRLIQFGIRNNCLYSWDEEKEGEFRHINVWEDAFNAPYEFYDRDILVFFNDLKKRISSFRHAKSFAGLRRQYFIFREKFFNMENCNEETDLVLSRCISELMELAELEKSFPDVPAVDPFLFFTEYLGEIFYLSKTKSSGVAILPYKTAAAAPFDCHIVLAAGQESLSVVYSRLDFLSKKKREELGIIDEDASTAFINMHKYNSLKISAFFCSEQTFSGFSIPHSKIGAPSAPCERYAFDPQFTQKFSEDYYRAEGFIYRADRENAHLKKLHENQINGFIEWKNRRRSGAPAYKIRKAGEEVKKIINNKFGKTGKYSVSATSLQSYFQCSLKWLFERVFALENIQIETHLMAENIFGLVYHAILNNFFNRLENVPLLKPLSTEYGISLPGSYKMLLERSTEEIFNCFSSFTPGETHMKPPNEASFPARLSALTARIMRAEKKEILYNLEKCLAHFISIFEGCSAVKTEIFYQAKRDTYNINGYVDCILKDNCKSQPGLEKYIIVDFKQKYLPCRADCTMEDENGLSNFQLPMYITLAEENEDFKVYTALFYSILDLKTEEIIGDNQIIRGSDCYNKIFEELNNKTELFAREISTGNFLVFAQKNSDCFECDYRRICRTVYVVNRENNILRKY